MKKKILIVGATARELEPIIQFLDSTKELDQDGSYTSDKSQFFILISGVGAAAMSARVTAFLMEIKVDLAICFGIAGAYLGTFSIGDVVYVATERWGDLGVEENDGSFKDIFEIGLVSPNEVPYQDRWLVNPDKDLVSFLPKAHGLTVNRVSGYPPSISRLREKYHADIESMEGAGFFYACLLNEVPFMEIRCISNLVKARNKAEWQIQKAINNLGEVGGQMLDSMA